MLCKLGWRHISSLFVLKKNFGNKKWGTIKKMLKINKIAI